jgi:hypothetical protein
MTVNVNSNRWASLGGHVVCCVYYRSINKFILILLINLLGCISLCFFTRPDFEILIGANL